MVYDLAADNALAFNNAEMQPSCEQHSSIPSISRVLPTSPFQTISSYSHSGAGGFVEGHSTTADREFGLLCQGSGFWQWSVEPGRHAVD